MAGPQFAEFYPFDQGYGSQANATRWRKMARLFMPDGIVRSGGEQLNGLQASLSGGNLIVQPGAVCVHGYYAEITPSQGAVTLPITSAAGMIVAQVDLDHEVVTLEWLSGVLDYNQLQQTEHIWQVPLWIVQNSTQLIWMGNTINPGRALATGAAYHGGWLSMNPGATYTWNIGKVRFSHPCLAFFHWYASFSIGDGRYAQNAVWSLALTGNPNGDIITGALEPFFWTGGGGLNPPPWYPVFNCSMSAVLWVNPGLYTTAIRVSVGTGAPVVTMNEAGINVIQTGSMSNI